jgi:hypothetical protein
MSADVSQHPSTPVVLAPGAVVSGRFEVESQITTVGPVPIYSAKDLKAPRKAALWNFTGHGLNEAAIEATRKAVRLAASIQQPDLVVPFGTAILSDGTLCVATEVVPVVSLADAIERKQHEGVPHTLAAAYPFIAQIADALATVHPNYAHGALAPATVRIENHKVRLAAMGLHLPLARLGVIPPEYVPPEVRRGDAPTPQSDVYALGAILYELLTGARPDPNVSPSSHVSSIPASLDVLIETCLSELPSDRLETVAALKNGIASIMGPAADLGRDEGIDIDIEVETDPVTGMVKPVTLPPGALTFSHGSPFPAAIPASDRPMAPSYPQPPAQPQAADADLGTLLKAVTANDSDRWMFSHDGLDHGPLTARELIAAIVRGEVLEGDVVHNMETGERKPSLQWPQYREFVETASEKRRGEARKARETEALAETSVTSTSKMVIAAAAVAMLCVVGFAYYMALGPGAKKRRSAAEIDDLVQRGELRVQTTSIQLLPPPPPSAARSHGGGHGGFTSYEAAMSAPVDYNFNGAGPSGGTLSDAEITRPLNASLNRFASCLSDGSARNVTLRLAIGGTGRATGVTVANGSPGLKGCVTGVVRSIQWRAFGGPRLGLSWGFGF